MNAVQTTHKARARFSGTLEWICPSCAHFNRSKVKHGHWRITCKRETCHKVYGFGIILYDLSALKRTGKAIVPDDITFPTAPVAALDITRPHVHEVVA